MATEAKNSRKPLDTPFRQQRMKAWQPILTPKWAVISFMTVGVIFIPIGVILYITSAKITTVEVRYDLICDYGPCTFPVTIHRDMARPVYFYYVLDNFYQNHRRYVGSRSESQLQGLDVPFSQLSVCEPVVTNPEGLSNPNVSQILNPCGLVAASMFNDTFVMKDASGTLIDWTHDGIVWPSDQRKYQPAFPNGNDVWKNATHPDFIVWMRTAALPKFKKLHRIILVDIPMGTYNVTVQNIYPVHSFGGSKSVYLSTVNWLGGRNDFLGLAYMIVGGICVVLAAIFLIKNAISPRVLGETSSINYNR